MADNLETSGLKIVAEGADKAVSDVGRVNKAFEGFGASIRGLASTLANGGSFEGIAKSIGNIATSTTGAVSSLSALGSAGGAAGSAVAVGMSAATIAVGSLIAIAGAAVLAIAAIGAAVSSAVAYGSSISRLSDSTGLSGGLAQSLSGGAAISGNSPNAIAGTFNAIIATSEKAGEAGDKALGKIGAAADKANTRLARLNADYARSIADITTSAAERIQESNDKLVESHAAMLARQARADEDYAREVADGRAQLAQRLADIDASANASIAALTQRQTRATEDYARETESARLDLAQSVFDIEQGLADDIEALQYRAAEQNTNAIDDGAQAQAKIQEDLQKQLYSIEQKYSSKRQSLQDKIYDPNTNPILRAYYKTQLGSLDKLQKAEEDGARAGASAKEAAQRRETEARLAEIARGLARETALEQQQAQRRVQRLQQEAAQRQAERLREFNQQSGDLAAQIARENAQRDQQSARARQDQALRENDLRRSYERQNADAKAAYDKQVVDAAAAQLKIQAETEKRLAAEKLQYDRAIEDINTTLANVGGGASAAAAGIDKAAIAQELFGISVEEFNKLSYDEQWKLINERINEFVSNGQMDKAIDLVQRYTGVTREQAAAIVRSSVASKEADILLKSLGFTDEQIEQARKTEEGFNTVKLALQLLGAQIGAVFLPIVLDMIAGIKSAYEWFIAKFLPALKDTYAFIKEKLEHAFVSLGSGATTLWNKIEPVRKLVDALANVAFVALDYKVREIEAFWSKYLGPALKAVGDYLSKTFGPIVDTLVNGILLGFTNQLALIKTGLDNLFNLLPRITGFFDGIANSISGLSLPSWLQPSGGGFNANVTYPPPPPGYNSGGSTRSIPATGAQMAAGNVSSSKTTNTNSASIVINVANGTKSNVESGVSSALFKAGFAVTK